MAARAAAVAAAAAAEAAAAEGEEQAAARRAAPGTLHRTFPHDTLHDRDDRDDHYDDDHHHDHRDNDNGDDDDDREEVLEEVVHHRKHHHDNRDQSTIEAPSRPPVLGSAPSSSLFPSTSSSSSTPSASGPHHASLYQFPAGPAPASSGTDPASSRSRTFSLLGQHRRRTPSSASRHRQHSHSASTIASTTTASATATAASAMASWARKLASATATSSNHQPASAKKSSDAQHHFHHQHTDRPTAYTHPTRSTLAFSSSSNARHTRGGSTPGAASTSSSSLSNLGLSRIFSIGRKGRRFDSGSDAAAARPSHSDFPSDGLGLGITGYDASELRLSTGENFVLQQQQQTSRRYSRSSKQKQDQDAPERKQSEDTGRLKSLVMKRRSRQRHTIDTSTSPLGGSSDGFDAGLACDEPQENLDGGAYLRAPSPGMPSSPLQMSLASSSPQPATAGVPPSSRSFGNVIESGAQMRPPATQATSSSLAVPETQASRRSTSRTPTEAHHTTPSSPQRRGSLSSRSRFYSVAGGLSPGKRKQSTELRRDAAGPTFGSPTLTPASADGGLMRTLSLRRDQASTQSPRHTCRDGQSPRQLHRDGIAHVPSPGAQTGPSDKPLPPPPLSSSDQASPRSEGGLPGVSRRRFAFARLGRKAAGPGSPTTSEIESWRFLTHRRKSSNERVEPPVQVLTPRYLQQGREGFGHGHRRGDSRDGRDSSSHERRAKSFDLLSRSGRSSSAVANRDANRDANVSDLARSSSLSRFASSGRSGHAVDGFMSRRFSPLSSLQEVANSPAGYNAPLHRGNASLASSPRRRSSDIRYSVSESRQSEEIEGLGLTLGKPSSLVSSDAVARIYSRNQACSPTHSARGDPGSPTALSDGASDVASTVRGRNAAIAASRPGYGFASRGSRPSTDVRPSLDDRAGRVSVDVRSSLEARRSADIRTSLDFVVSNMTSQARREPKSRKSTSSTADPNASIGSSSSNTRPYSMISVGSQDTEITRYRKLVVDTTDSDGEGEDREGRGSELWFRKPGKQSTQTQTVAVGHTTEPQTGGRPLKVADPQYQDSGSHPASGPAAEPIHPAITLTTNSSSERPSASEGDNTAQEEEARGDVMSPLAPSSHRRTSSILPAGKRASVLSSEGDTGLSALEAELGTAKRMVVGRSRANTLDLLRQTEREQSTDIVDKGRGAPSAAAPLLPARSARAFEVDMKAVARKLRAQQELSTGRQDGGDDVLEESSQSSQQLAALRQTKSQGFNTPPVATAEDVRQTSSLRVPQDRAGERGQAVPLRSFFVQKSKSSLNRSTSRSSDVTTTSSDEENQPPLQGQGTQIRPSKSSYLPNATVPRVPSSSALRRTRSALADWSTPTSSPDTGIKADQFRPWQPSSRTQGALPLARSQERIDQAAGQNPRHLHPRDQRQLTSPSAKAGSRRSATSSGKKTFATSEEAIQAKQREAQRRERKREKREREKELARMRRYADMKKADPLLKERLALMGLQHVQPQPPSPPQAHGAPSTQRATDSQVHVQDGAVTSQPAQPRPEATHAPKQALERPEPASQEAPGDISQRQDPDLESARGLRQRGSGRRLRRGSTTGVIQRIGTSGASVSRSLTTAFWSRRPSSASAAVPAGVGPPSAAVDIPEAPAGPSGTRSTSATTTKQENATASAELVAPRHGGAIEGLSLKMQQKQREEDSGQQATNRAKPETQAWVRKSSEALGHTRNVSLLTEDSTQTVDSSLDTPFPHIVGPGGQGTGRLSLGEMMRFPNPPQRDWDEDTTDVSGLVDVASLRLKRGEESARRGSSQLSRSQEVDVDDTPIKERKQWRWLQELQRMNLHPQPRRQPRSDRPSTSPSTIDQRGGHEQDAASQKVAPAADVSTSVSVGAAHEDAPAKIKLSRVPSGRGRVVSPQTMPAPKVDPAVTEADIRQSRNPPGVDLYAQDDTVDHDSGVAADDKPGTYAYASTSTSEELTTPTRATFTAAAGRRRRLGSAMWDTPEGTPSPPPVPALPAETSAVAGGTQARSQLAKPRQKSKQRLRLHRSYTAEMLESGKDEGDDAEVRSGDERTTAVAEEKEEESDDGDGDCEVQQPRLAGESRHVWEGKGQRESTSTRRSSTTVSLRTSGEGFATALEEDDEGEESGVHP